LTLDNDDDVMMMMMMVVVVTHSQTEPYYSEIHLRHPGQHTILSEKMTGTSVTLQ